MSLYERFWHAGVARASDKVADSVASFLPGSIPRGVAKGGILTVGALVVLSLLQKVRPDCHACSGAVQHGFHGKAFVACQISSCGSIYACIKLPSHEEYGFVAQIFSTFLFLGVIGGAALLWSKLNSGKASSGGSGSSDGDDPLSNARRIMDKYK